MQSQSNGNKNSRIIKRMLLALSLSCVLMVSGCGSNSQMPVCAQSQVVVDPTLMAKPSYQAELLNFLSDKPSEPTTK
ncbi:Rz1-like lysis protein [Pseudomonas phage vB_PsyP_3MF5]|uniref:Rz-like spanin n=1 Tax=Pseudomonas phage vB_PsyP_3MF5 TaxID=2749426 RepID=UPI001BD93B01|nr:Rz-like spanin [Pseudomonas phage vB_PsyP_3MF5]QLI47598.1 Rz1-like lysis protein [Pseudomonas phage vB_PsyP_3MF5]